MRNEFAALSKEELKYNQDAVVLLGDISMGLFLDENERLPERCFNVGILEQSMISMSAGLASSGMLPIVHTISAFLIERCLEQIKLDLIYNKNRAVLISANGPFDYNKLGPTHHAANDVTLLDDIGLSNLYLPYSTASLRQAFLKAKGATEASYIRLAKRTFDEIDTYEDLNGAKLSTKADSQALSVFVGEAASLAFDDEVNNGDSIFIHDFNCLPIIDLTPYKKVSVWEPYSRPIVAPRIIKGISDLIVEVWCYPKMIQSGIFDKVTYERHVL